MARTRFSERQVIEALIRTGHKILCFRTKAVITLETVGRLEREHPTPLKLGGKDDPTNAAYSLSEAHSVQTNGKPHTSYGSDKHAIAKVKRLRGETCSGPTKQIRSRGFDKTKTRKFDRSVVPEAGMNTSTNTADLARPCISNGTPRKSLFERTRRNNETIVTWLERLCDEHNAPLREKI